MMNKLTAVITGDIIDSRKVTTKEWIEPFKKILNRLGSKNKSWEIYRGDSFQLEIGPEIAFESLLLLKSTIKQIKLIDVRIAIGIGEKDFKTTKITESNGSAFIRAGFCFDNLKKQTMGIRTEQSELDVTLNLMFELAALTMNKWTENTAYIIQQSLLNPNIGQKELEQKLNLLQSSISRGLKRGGYDEIQKLNTYYKKTINNL